jgi:hypothetical protein
MAETVIHCVIEGKSWRQRSIQGRRAASELLSRVRGAADKNRRPRTGHDDTSLRGTLASSLDGIGGDYNRKASSYARFHDDLPGRAPMQCGNGPAIGDHIGAQTSGYGQHTSYRDLVEIAVGLTAELCDHLMLR